MSRKVAFITGASRGIGAEAAVALARIGYDVALTARTLAEGQGQDYGGTAAALPGSLQATASAVEQLGGKALCLQADLLEPVSMLAAADAALAHFGRMDFLFNNGIFQGAGVLSDLHEVTLEQLQNIYQGNVFTPLALVQQLLPALEEQPGSLIINMVSHAAFHNPPAAATRGGWSFAYSSSKAALARMVGSLRVEHPDNGLRAFNLEPGMVITEVMRAAGIDETLLARYKPCSAAAIGAVVAWLAANEPPAEFADEDTVHAPALGSHLKLLGVQSGLGA